MTEQTERLYYSKDKNMNIKNLYTSIVKFAFDYKNREQCKIDWCCRMNSHAGLSIYDIARRSRNAEIFIEDINDIICQSFYMGLITLTESSKYEAYTKIWGAYLPRTDIGWKVYNFALKMAEKRKKIWTSTLR